MYCHIVPQVYQKAWRNRLGESNVFYFSKGDLTKPRNKQGGNVEKNMGIKNEYILDSSESVYNIDPNPKAVEDFFSHGMENSWNGILDSDLELWISANIGKEVDGKKGLLGIKADCLIGTPYERKLHEHMILQHIRVFEQFLEIDKMTNGGLIDYILYLVNEICKTQYPEKQLSNADLDMVIQDEKYKKSIWKSILIDCQKNPSNSYLAKVYDLLLDQGNLVFFATGNSETKYILSDRPVIWNCGKTKRHNHLESGLFFPISPTLLVAHLRFKDEIKLERGDAVCLAANNNFVRYVNHVLHEQSDKLVGFSDEDIAKHVSRKPFSRRDWDEMFTAK